MAFKFKKKKHRPPVEGPLRRLPGQSIRDERERLFDDHALGYLLTIALAWVFDKGLFCLRQRFGRN